MAIYSKRNAALAELRGYQRAAIDAVPQSVRGMQTTPGQHLRAQAAIPGIERNLRDKHYAIQRDLRNANMQQQAIDLRAQAIQNDQIRQWAQLALQKDNASWNKQQDQWNMARTEANDDYGKGRDIVNDQFKYGAMAINVDQFNQKLKEDKRQFDERQDYYKERDVSKEEYDALSDQEKRAYDERRDQRRAAQRSDDAYTRGQIEAINDDQKLSREDKIKAIESLRQQNAGGGGHAGGGQRQAIPTGGKREVPPEALKWMEDNANSNEPEVLKKVAMMQQAYGLPITARGYRNIYGQQQ
jgi:predicted phage tail protein